MNSSTTSARFPRRTPSGVSQIDYRPRSLSDDQLVRRAHGMASRPRVRAIATACTATRRRRRKLGLQTVLAIAFLHALTRPPHLTIAAMLRTIDRLTDNQRGHLGIPRGMQVEYRYVNGGLKRIASCVGVSIAHNHERGSDAANAVDECPQDCPGHDLTEDQIATILVQAGVPPMFSPPSAVALDGTDVESFYPPYFNGAKGANGRVCACPDARWGKRTATDRRPTEWYVGFEAHLATYILGAGAHGELPLLCAGLALRPGVRDRAGAALGLVRSLTAFGPVHEVLYDRGYSTAKAEHLAHPLHELGISTTFDLHSTQRGPRPGPVPGTIWVDGSLFSTALPEPLHRLDPPDVGNTPETKGHIRDVFTARTAYAFVPHSKPVAGRHARRFKGPALAGHVRCPNVPASMRLGSKIPTTNCTRGEVCGCGITVAVPDTVLERDRQPLPWQTNAWAQSYDRRTLVEGLNAQARLQAMGINRGYIRVRGRTLTMLLVAIALAGYNATHLHDWYVGRGLPEPWQEHLGEPVHEHPMRRYTRTRGNRRRSPTPQK